MRVVKTTLSVLCYLLFFSDIGAIGKGSDFLISLEPFFSFPASDSDNQMATFGFFKNGFGLQDSTTTCTFNSVFPVSGSLNLNGGQLYLTNDLIVQDVATLDSAGLIIGNNHTMELSSGITGIPAVYNSVFKDTRIFLNSDFLISGNVKFKGDCLLDGRWNRISLGSNANIVIDRNSRLCLRNIEIDQIKSSNIRCLDHGGSIILDNVVWDQDADFTFTNGSIKFINHVTFSGPWKFNYQTTLTSTIDEDSTWFVSDLTQITIGRQGSVFGREPIYFTDITSNMMMKNCVLNVSQYGMRVTRGTMLISGEVKFDIDSTGSTNGLAFGNGDVTQDMLLKFFPASVINLERGDLVHDVVALGNFVSDDVQKIFMRQGVGANYWSNFDSYFVNVDLRFALGGISYLAPGKHGYFNNCRASVAGMLDFTVTATRISDFIFGLYSGGRIAVTSGNFIAPLGIVAYGTGNVFTSMTDVSGSLSLKNTSAQLAIGINGVLSSNVAMNGGTLILSSDLKLDKAVILTGTGTLSLGTKNLTLGSQDTIWTSSILFSGSGSQVSLRSLLSLTSTVTFSGTCTINGYGNELHMSSAGKIIVAKNSTLKINQTRLTGLLGTSIRCFDNSSKIILQDVDWIQSGNYTFTVGGLKVQGVCRFIGDSYQFAYQTRMTSTIDKLARLLIDKGLTFSYDPITMRQKGIMFADSTSELLFNNSILYATKGGIQMQGGRVRINGNATFFSDFNTLLDGTISTTSGIIFGNNDGTNDSVIDIAPGAKLILENGYLIYRDTVPTSLIMENTLSALRINPGGILRLEQSLPLDPGVLQLSSSSALERLDGISVNGSVDFFG